MFEITFHLLGLEEEERIEEMFLDGLPRVGDRVGFEDIEKGCFGKVIKVDWNILRKEDGGGYQNETWNDVYVSFEE